MSKSSNSRHIELPDDEAHLHPRPFQKPQRDVELEEQPVTPESVQQNHRFKATIVMGSKQIRQNSSVDGLWDGEENSQKWGEDGVVP
jgi:hypothetical protein